ncbi:hypothetical protein B7494_g7494 [Chlorociboria aeruginascens]|nr:hypothetical protein B7494_g7494 [Chlorociboria aeruginascens]
MADSVGGDGLARSERDSPPPYRSPRSFDGIPYSELTEEQRRNAEEQLRLDRLMKRRRTEWEASTPREQFRVQTAQLERQLIEDEKNGRNQNPTMLGARMAAEAIIKKDWVEQGIWNNDWAWNEIAFGRWKHEQPLVLEPEPEKDPLMFLFDPKPPKSEEEKRRIAERRVLLKRDHEASRPCHQFSYQISKERERMHKDAEVMKVATPADISTKAYENVKSTWMSRMIWKEDWGILPGMSWKHEEPFQGEAPDAAALLPADLPVNGSPEVREAPAPPILPFASRPIQSDLLSAFGTLEDNEPLPSAPNASRLRTGRIKSGQPQPAAGPSLGPIHPSRRMTWRRSERISNQIQPPITNISVDPTKSASSNPSKRAVRSKSERKVTNRQTARSPAKPQGISEEQPVKRGRPRKN